jgi:hypothetical protein
MTSLTLLGDTSGSIVLDAPAVSGSTTLTLPATTGTVMVGSGVGAWTAYTPTISAASGTITTSSATGQYQTIGKTCILNMNITITTVGSASGSCNATLPFTSASNIQIGGYGMEVNTNGAMLKGYIGGSTSTLQITSYANGSPFAYGSGSVFVMTVVYQIV